MSAPECGAPTKKDGQPCRRRRYHPCDDHGASGDRTAVRPPGKNPPEPAEPDLSYYRDPRWRHQAKSTLGKIFRADAQKLRELRDCRDLATAARVLESAARLDPNPLLEGIEEQCSTEHARVIREATSKVLERLTGIDSLKDLARALRIAGVWHCVLTEALETCPCLEGLGRDVERGIRTELLISVNGLIQPPEA